MARQQWPLYQDQPVVEIVLTPSTGPAVTRRLLADTGAGTNRVGFELLLDEQDCLLVGSIPSQAVVLGGAYAGTFPVYVIRVELPALAARPRHQSLARRQHPPRQTPATGTSAMSVPLYIDHHIKAAITDGFILVAKQTLATT